MSASIIGYWMTDEVQNKSKPVSRVLFPDGDIRMLIIYLALTLPSGSSSLPNRTRLRTQRAAVSFEVRPIWPFNP